MSRGAGALQRRTTTYLISLTLVKLESVPPPPPSPFGGRSRRPWDQRYPRPRIPAAPEALRSRARSGTSGSSTGRMCCGSARVARAPGAPGALAPSPAPPARPAPSPRLPAAALLWAAPPGPPLSGGLSPDSPKPGAPPPPPGAPCLAARAGGPGARRPGGRRRPRLVLPAPRHRQPEACCGAPPPAPKPCKTVTTSGAKAGGQGRR